MTIGLLLGCGLGAAVCLLLFALVPPRPQLASQVNRWERSRSRQAAVTRVAQAEVTWQQALGQWLAAELAQRGWTMKKLRANLELTDQSLETHLVKKMMLALVGLLIPSVLMGVLFMTGVGGFAMPMVFLGLGFAALLFWIPDVQAAKDAAQRRTELRRALSCYLDLVAMSLSGGRGVPQALPMAANIGTGWAFELIQDTLGRARRVGDTPWAALADLGDRTGMQELQDLGGALMLVADDGAKVKASLTARAATQRRRQLAEAEGAAEKADQTIQIAQVVLAAGFFLFIGFPAVINVMGI